MLQLKTKLKINVWHIFPKQCKLWDIVQRSELITMFWLSQPDVIFLGCDDTSQHHFCWRFQWKARHWFPNCEAHFTVGSQTDNDAKALSHFFIPQSCWNWSLEWTLKDITPTVTIFESLCLCEDLIWNAHSHQLQCWGLSWWVMQWSETLLFVCLNTFKLKAAKQSESCWICKSNAETKN